MNNINIPFYQQQMQLQQILEELKKLNMIMKIINDKINCIDNDNKKNYLNKNDSLYML